LTEAYARDILRASWSVFKKSTIATVLFWTGCEGHRLLLSQNLEASVDASAHVLVLTGGNADTEPAFAGF
jgi:hypothetical protein